MRVLVDSDILIEVSSGKNIVVLEQWRSLFPAGNVVMYSPVSVAELWAGARPKEHTLLDELFHALTCVPIDEFVARQAGLYVNRFGKSHSLEVDDALIASCAKASHSVLWTRNRKHYPMQDIEFFQ